ncbi:MAG TPA: SulP family inorganic anion transporter [Stellaceae bacterium]|nr:SulP family inorganic anion transporter [Stellaceae bacterium]
MIAGGGAAVAPGSRFVSEMIGRIGVVRLGFVRREMMAGLTAGLVALPVCIASGVLAYAPLGVHSIAQGASAGLTGGAFSAIFAAIFSTSSFVISSPRASISIIQGTLAAWLLQNPAFHGHPVMIIDAMSLCGMLAGVWQMLFSITGIEKIIKCTPHPVLAGFINGVALLVIAQQFWLLLDLPTGWPGDGSWLDATALAKLALALALAVFIVYLGAWSKRVPAMLVGLLLGIVLYHLVRVSAGGASLGPTIDLTGGSQNVPFLSLLSAGGRGAFLGIGPALLLSSLILALVAALESMLAYRVAQNLSNVRTEAARDVFGQGVGNFAAALVGGIAAAASSSQLTANYEAGGRSRLSVLSAAVMLLAVQAGLRPLWSAVPAIAIWAVLLAIAVLLFDPWSMRLLRDLLLAPARVIASGAWRQLAVAAVVTTVIASGAVIGGVLVGIGLACLLFIADMSRDIERRRYRGDEVFSKRLRPAADMELLQRTGRRRAVLELHGVMFFANADELSREIHNLFREADMLALDLRAVTDIDVTAATILQHEAVRARRTGKRLLFASPLPELEERLNSSESGGPLPPDSLFADADTALEWMEEEVLSHEVRATSESIPLERHDLMRGLTAAELEIVAPLLRHTGFPAGTVLCREGEEAEEMWILTRGSVSVRLFFAGARRMTRVASLAVGTIVGDMAFIEGSRRSATIVADEPVECYAIDRADYAAIVRHHPEIATKLLTNLLAETMRRLRATSDQLRAMSG